MFVCSKVQTCIGPSGLHSHSLSLVSVKSRLVLPFWYRLTRVVPDNTHTHPFNGPLSRTTRVSRYQKGKPIWILLKQYTVSGSGISWALCKSAPCCRQTRQHPTTQFFTGWMPFLPPNQERQSTEGTVPDKGPLNRWVCARDCVRSTSEHCGFGRRCG